jgi:MFS family permease
MLLMSGPALVADTVAPERTGLAMSCISINLSLGLTLGPLLGGIMYDRVGWYGIFGVGFGILVIDILLRLVMIEKRVARGFDFQLPIEPETSKDAEESNKGVKERSKLPDVIALLLLPRFLAALWLTFIQATIISVFDTVLPLHLNQLFGWTSFQAGSYTPLGSQVDL